MPNKHLDHFVVQNQFDLNSVLPSILIPTFQQGGPQHIKSKFGQGFQIIIKVGVYPSFVTLPAWSHLFPVAWTHVGYSQWNWQWTSKPSQEDCSKQGGCAGRSKVFSCQSGKLLFNFSRDSKKNSPSLIPALSLMSTWTMSTSTLPILRPPGAISLGEIDSFLKSK